jgi:hypothetical protein
MSQQCNKCRLDTADLGIPSAFTRQRLREDRRGQKERQDGVENCDEMG